MLVHTPIAVKNIENIRTALESSNAVLIQGEIGCGKTLAVDYLSDLLGFKETLIQVDVDDSFDSKDLLGKFSATETPGAFQWVPGPLTIAVEKGYWVLMEDIDLASFDVFSVLLSLLENSTLFISDKNRVISAHPNFKLIATQQIVVSGDALFSKKNSIPHQELWGTVIMKRVPSVEQCEIVHCMYNRVPLPILEALTSFSENCTSSNVINLRTLLRWGKRVNRRLELKTSSSDNPLFYSSTIREMFLKEAYDCFVARFAPGNEQQTVFKLISDACGVPLAVAETLVLENRPNQTVGLTECTFGRVTLPMKSLSRVTRESRIAFAETRQAMSLLECLAAAVENGEHVLLTGETGVGKTFVVQYLADQLGQNLLVHNLNQQTDTSDFMGGWKPLDLGITMRDLFNKFTYLFGSCFSVEKNAEFLNATQNAFSSRNWERTIKLIQKGCVSFSQKFVKQGGYSNEIIAQWNELRSKADETLSIVLQTSSNMAFFYEEGSLVKAWREGHWILLDELNLATTEVLERVSSVLGDVDRIFLTDKGSSEVIPRHKNFHVFANMNPPTDVGKKDLPPSLRSRFTELYVNEPFNASDVSTIVREYIGFLTPDAKIHEITDFFLDCVSNAKSKLCAVDGESKPPSFSMRTLTRALSYVRKATPCYGFNVSLFDGLLLGFATPLQRQFHKVIEGLIVKNIFRGKQPASPKLPSPPSDGEYVPYQHIWIKAGSNTPFNDERFILTNSVKGHLTNLSRAVFANRPVLLEGPTSSGKSSMVQYLAQLTGNTFVRINNHESTEVQEYLGHYVTDEYGKLRFVDGILVNAVRNGYWVVLDELNLAPTDVLEALNRLLDDNCELFIPDTQETIKPHPGLRIFATQNPAGIYGGRKVLSRAFRNRFLEITVDDIPADEIVVILKCRYSMPEGFAIKVVEVMNNLQIRRQSSQIFAGKHGFITPRDLFRWAERKPSTYQELAEHGFLLLGERCRKEEGRQIVKDVIESVTKTVISEDELYKPSHWPFVNKYYNLIHDGTIDEFKIVWTASMQRLFTIVGICLKHLEPVLLVGETGSSKTTVCQLWSALMGVPLRILNFHQHSEAADFLGSLRPVPPDRRGQALFEWRDGPLVECMREGFFFLLDEISLTEDSVLERLNSVLEPSRSITLAEKSNGESFVAHERFRVLATMNPGGDFGKKELSPALRNRFTEVYVRPTTEEGEVATIISKRLLPELSEKWSTMMAKVLCCLTGVVLPSTGGSPTHISIRDIISWVEFMNAVSGRCADELAFANGLDALLLDGIGVGSGQVEGTIELLKKTCLREIEKVLFDCMPQFEVSLSETRLNTKHQPVGNLPESPPSSSSSSSLSSSTLSSLQEMVEQKPFWEVLAGMSEPTLPPHLQSRFFFGAPTTQRNLSKLLRSTVLRKAVLLEGSPGVGKTSIVEALGAALGVRVVRINLSDQTDVMDLFGTFLPRVVEEEESEEEEEQGEGSNETEKEQEEIPQEEEAAAVRMHKTKEEEIPKKKKGKGPVFAWSDGVLLQALKEGAWAILDELNLASQSVLEGLNALLDHRATVFIPELNKSFNAHPNFRIFACQNPLAEGGGRKGLPRSFLNRFVKVRMEAFTREDLMVITQAICSDIPFFVLSGMVDFVAELQRETMWKRSFGLRGSPWEFNLRDVLRWAGLLRRYKETSNPMIFADMLFGLRFRAHEDRLRCRALLHKYFVSPQGKKEEPNHETDAMSFTSSSAHSSPDSPSSMGSHPSSTTAVYSSDFLLVGNTIVYKGRALLECLHTTDVAPSPRSASYERMGESGTVDHTSVMIARTSLAPGSVGEKEETSAFSSTTSYSSRVDRPLLLLPSQGDIVAALLMCAAQSQFAILVGASGSGKTFVLQTAAALAGATLVTFSINASCDTVDLLGGFDQVEDKQGEFEWRDSLILEAMQQGYWLVLDNVNYCHASVLDRLNPLVEPNGVLYVNEQGLVQGKVRRITPHPQFRLFATMNPRYGEISRAMRNRAVEICVSPVPLPSLEGLTLCATASPALSLCPFSCLSYNPSPMTSTSFSFAAVLSHFAQFHHHFVRQSFGASTLLPLSPSLSDANAAGSPNIFTLIRASFMLPSFLEKVMKKRQMEKQALVEEEGQGKDEDPKMFFPNVLSHCLVEVLQHCYLENRLGSWRHQKEKLEQALREVYSKRLESKVLEWEEKRLAWSDRSEEQEKNSIFHALRAVKKEEEEDGTSTATRQTRDEKQGAHAGHLEGEWCGPLSFTEPRMEDAIQAFTLGSPSSLLNTFSTSSYPMATPSTMYSGSPLLARRLLQCRVWRSGMALQKIIREEKGEVDVTSSFTPSDTLTPRTLPSLADVLAAFVLEQATDGAVLEELSIIRREFLQQIFVSPAHPCLDDTNTADSSEMSNVKEEENGKMEKETSDVQEKISSSADGMISRVRLVNAVEHLLHPQYCFPSQLPRLLSFTRMAVGPYTDVLERAYKVEQEGLALFIADAPSVNRSASRVVVTLLHALRAVAVSPSVFQSLLGRCMAFFREVFQCGAASPSSATPVTRSAIAVTAPSVLTGRHFVPLVSRALLLLEWEPTTFLSSTAEPSCAVDTRVGEELKTAVMTLLDDIRRFLELPFPITGGRSLLQPLLASVHITSEEERQVLASYQGIVQQKIEEEEEEERKGKASRAALRPLWKIAAFRAEFSLMQRLLSLCSLSPITSSYFPPMTGSVASASSTSYSCLLGASTLATAIHTFIVDFTERMPLYTALDLSLWTSVREALMPAVNRTRNPFKGSANYPFGKNPSSVSTGLQKNQRGGVASMQEEGKQEWRDTQGGQAVWEDVRRYAPLVVTHVFQRHRTLHAVYGLFFGSWSTAASRCLRFARDVPVMSIGLGKSNPHAEALTSFLTFLSRCPKAPRDPLGGWRRHAEIELLQIVSICFPSVKPFCEELLQAPPQRRKARRAMESIYTVLPQMIQEMIQQEQPYSSTPTPTRGGAGGIPLPRPEWALIQMLLDTLRPEKNPSCSPSSSGQASHTTCSSCFPLRAIALLCALKCRLLLPSSPIDPMYRRALQVSVAREEGEHLSQLAGASRWAARVAYRSVDEEEHAEEGAPVSSSCVSEREVPHLGLLRCLQAEESERERRAAEGWITRPDPTGGQFADLTRELHRLVQTFFSDDRLQQVLSLSSLPISHTCGEERMESGEEEVDDKGRQRVEGQGMLREEAERQQVLRVWGELLFQETMTLLHQYGGYEDTTLHLAQASLFAAVTSYAGSAAVAGCAGIPPRPHEHTRTNSSTVAVSSSASHVPMLSGMLLADVPTVLRQLQFPCALHSPVPLPSPPRAHSSSFSSFPLARRLHYLDACLTLLAATIPPSLHPSFAAGLFASYRSLYSHVEELNERERQAEQLTVKYKEPGIFIEGDDEKMLKKLKNLFPSYEKDFASLLQDQDEEDGDPDQHTHEEGGNTKDTNTTKKREEKRDEKQVSRAGNQARILFAEKDGLYVRRLVDTFTSYYTRLLDGRLDQQQFSMDLYLESYKGRFDTLSSELRDWSAHKGVDTPGAMMGIADDLDDREECLLMSGFAARAALVRKEFSSPQTSVATKNAAGFNIFKDPEPSELNHFSVPLGRLIKRLVELLEEYPENATLLHCLRVAKTVGELKALQTPLMKVMTGCEVLLSQCYEWERNASTAVSLMPFITEFSAFILRWRRLELYSWGHIFKAKREEFELTASLKWFEFYDMIHLDKRAEKDEVEYEEERGEDDEDELTRCLLLFQQLSPYLWGASIGDFSARLRVVKGLAYSLATRCGLTSPLTNVALHIVDFFSQFEAFVQEKCTAAIKPLEEEMHEFCQIMRWEDANYYAVRATVEKSHLKIARVLSSLEDVLRTPILPLLNAEEERCLEDPAMGFTLPSDPNEKGKKGTHEKKGKEKKNTGGKAGEGGKGKTQGKTKSATGNKRSRNGEVILSTTLSTSLSMSAAVQEGVLVTGVEEALVSGWPVVAKAISFFQDGAAEVITTVSSLQGKKVSQQLKLRSLKLLFDRLAWCGIPHTHEQQVEHWEVLYSSTEALLGCRTAFSHQLSSEDHTVDSLIPFSSASSPSLTAEMISTASQELYRFCRWVQRMREGERHPHPDLSGAQVKRGTGTVESLLAHLIQLSRWCFQLFALHDGISTLMKLMKDGVMHGVMESHLVPALPATTRLPLCTSSQEMDGSVSLSPGAVMEPRIRTVSEVPQRNVANREGAMLARVELLNHSLQWVSILRNASSSFHWMQKESLATRSRPPTVVDGTVTSAMPMPSTKTSSSIGSSITAFSLPLHRMKDEEEGEEGSSATLEYSEEDRASLMELHKETENLWEMCVDCEVVRRTSPILPVAMAQRFHQAYERLFAVCTRLQQQHGDAIVRAAAAVCARALAKDIASWEATFYCTAAEARMGHQEVDEEEDSVEPQRQRHRLEEEETEGTMVPHVASQLLPSEETTSLGAVLSDFNHLWEYCGALDISSSVTVCSPLGKEEAQQERETGATQDSLQTDGQTSEERKRPPTGESEVPLLVPSVEGHHESEEEKKEEEDEEHHMYLAYTQHVNTMQKATEKALEVVSTLLFTSPSQEDASTTIWLHAMPPNEGGVVYAQLQHAKHIVEHAKCEAIQTLKCHAFFGVVLSRLLAILLKKGFCKSNEEEEDGKGDGEQGGVQEGTGMDDGQGEKDVTKEMENEDQLMNEKDKEEQPRDEKNKKDDGNDEEKEDNAADVETDFAGEKEQREESGEDENDEDNESDQEMGEVGEEDEVQDRKRSRRDKDDQEELNEDDGDAADEVPLDELEEHGEKEDEETGGFQNREEEIRDQQEEDGAEQNNQDRQIVGDDEKDNRSGDDEEGIEDDQLDEDIGESREDEECSWGGSREEEAEGDEENDALSVDKDKDVDEDRDGDEEREGEEEDDGSSIEGEEDTVSGEDGDEDRDKASDVDSTEDPADRNVFDAGEQDDRVGEEATERKEEHEDRRQEQQRRNDTAGMEEEQEMNEDEQDDAGRNWKKKQEENASAQRKDDTQQQRRAEQSNPYKAMKEALQRHQRQAPQQLNLNREVQVEKKKETEKDSSIPKPNRHHEEEEEEKVDHFEFDEEGEEEGMAATNEYAPPTVEEEESPADHDEEEEEDQPQDRPDGEDSEDQRRKRKTPSDLTDLNMEEEGEVKKKRRGRKKASKDKSTAHLESDEDKEQEEEPEEEEEERNTAMEEKLEKGRQRWQEHEAAVQGLAQQLCEQLRLILAPTLADKLQGDYKTGKRLNMKRIIPYIASQFKKDRIWLRRTKPNKRTYQIMVALDDSLSMQCNEAGEFCCRAVTLMAKALQQLESGEVGIARFGEETQLLHPLEEPFTPESGPRVFSEITFAQNSTKLSRFLDFTLGYLDAARERLYGQTRSTSQELLQLLYIFSDGQITENRADIRKLMIRAEENHQMVVFVILDIKAAETKGEEEKGGRKDTQGHSKAHASSSPAPLKASDLKGLSAAERLRRLKADREKRLQRVQSKSILDMQLVEFKGGQVIRKGYMEDFPFPYYLIVRELDRLPEIIADSMRQWFELLNGH